MSLAKYTKQDLKKIVEIYNLSIDEKTLKLKKAELIKEMNKKGKGQLDDTDKIDKKLQKKESMTTEKKTHKMPDGKVMSGKTHSKQSKPIAKQSKPIAKQSNPSGKDSKKPKKTFKINKSTDSTKY